MPRPLIIGPAEKSALQAVRAAAEANPFLPAGTGPGVIAKREAALQAQTVAIPIEYRVTYSVEIYPLMNGLTFRHMSINVEEWQDPTAHQLWAIALELGFTTLQDSEIWVKRHGTRAHLNLVQSLIPEPSFIRAPIWDIVTR